MGWQWENAGDILLKQSKRLKSINSFSAGVNPIMDGSISELPVRLTNAKGIHGKTMALTTAGYMIRAL